MLQSKKSMLISPLSLALGLFLAAGAQTGFAQDSHPKNQAEHKSQKMSSGDRGSADRDQWDLTDEMAEGWIIVKLAAHHGFDDVNVEVQDGVAKLSGKVASDAAENRALRIANRTMGVESVRDQLTVDTSIDNNKEAKNVPDQELTKQVAQKIADKIEGAKAGKDWWFAGWRVEGPYNRWNFVVDADRGYVTLDGDVPSMEIMRKAVEAAGHVAGVRTVDSDLNLESYPGYYAPLNPRYPYYNQYYGYAYPYYPHVRAPHNWAGDQSDRFARQKDNSQQ